MVQFKNETDKPVTIQRHARLGEVTEYNGDGYFLVNSEEHPLVATGWKLHSKDKPMEVLPELSKEAGHSGLSNETTLPNGVRIYGDITALKALKEVVDEFDIWTDRGETVDIPEDQHMPIDLLPEIKYQPARIYPLSTKDREVVDAALDKLQKTGKVKFTTQPTPFSYPVFVVWKMIDGKKVGRMVVDIRGLNHITRPDTHPIPLQSDMISCVAGCLYISLVDGNGYFHQWTVKRDDRYKITVISHRGQEEFQVAPMGFHEFAAICPKAD